MNNDGFKLLYETLRMTFSRWTLVIKKSGILYHLSWLFMTIPLTLSLILVILWIDFFNTIAQLNKLIMNQAKQKNNIISSIYFPFFFLFWYLTLIAFFFGRLISGLIANCGRPVIWLEKRIGII
jgi:hypothetical protein